ncbi:GNAT family N-acetyltransferase [Mesorhizobium loti]|uniref:GNAT family N-acetyltransferase n=2 Tax=Mesorhizobium TaxID=68287 RepID=UPI001FDEDA80|nr:MULTISPECIES: GNAT family N-acetyltransferase [Mesorhizobium]
MRPERYWAAFGTDETRALVSRYVFLPQHLRRRWLGARLLAQVEEEARRRGCKGAVVETSSFQARQSYTSQSYEEFARVDFGVEQYARICHRKTWT